MNTMARPIPPDATVYEKDSPNFVWNALEKKLKLGFIASSDHGSTHMSFAAVYTKTIDRPGVFDGLQLAPHLRGHRQDHGRFRHRRRHHGPGDHGVRQARAQRDGGRHRAIAQIDIIKNGKFAYATKPGISKARFTFRDEAVERRGRVLLRARDSTGQKHGMGQPYLGTEEELMTQSVALS